MLIINLDIDWKFIAFKVQKFAYLSTPNLVSITSHNIIYPCAIFILILIQFFLQFTAFTVTFDN